MPITDTDDQEVLNISDDGADTLSAAEVEVDPNDTDRGDDFIDPEKAEAEGTGDEQADEPEKGEGNAAIPPHRLGEMSREKNAGIDLGVAFMEGTVDRSLVEELGGYKAVVKAIANRELSIDDLKSVGTQGDAQPVAQPAAVQPQVNDDPNAPVNWDMDVKYIEYQEMVDAGEVRDAAALLRQINKEERERERTQERAVQSRAETMAHVQQLVADYPVLNDTKSPEHEAVMVWADHFQRVNGLTRAAALDKAIIKAGIAGAEAQGQSETPQQRTIRLRKEAAMKKGAAASIQQPPPMGLGATPAGAAPPRDLTKVPEHEFANASEEEKARARGDFL